MKMIFVIELCSGECEAREQNLCFLSMRAEPLLLYAREQNFLMKNNYYLKKKFGGNYNGFSA